MLLISYVCWQKKSEFGLTNAVSAPQSHQFDDLGTVEIITDLTLPASEVSVSAQCLFTGFLGDFFFNFCFTLDIAVSLMLFYKLACYITSNNNDGYVNRMHNDMDIAVSLMLFYILACYITSNNNDGYVNRMHNDMDIAVSLMLFYILACYITSNNNDGYVSHMHNDTDMAVTSVMVVVVMTLFTDMLTVGCSLH